MMEENSYIIALRLKGKLLSEISYAKSVIESVGEPCIGYCKRLYASEKLLKHIDEFFNEIKEVDE